MGATWKRSKKNQGPKKKARQAGALSRLVNRVEEDWKGLAGADKTTEIHLVKAIKRQEKEIHILRTKLGMAV